jgi:hypothetical protein
VFSEKCKTAVNNRRVYDQQDSGKGTRGGLLNCAAIATLGVGHDTLLMTGFSQFQGQGVIGSTSHGCAFLDAGVSFFVTGASQATGNHVGYRSV